MSAKYQQSWLQDSRGGKPRGCSENQDFDLHLGWPLKNVPCQPDADCALGMSLQLKKLEEKLTAVGGRSMTCQTLA